MNLHHSTASIAAALSGGNDNNSSSGSLNNSSINNANNSYSSSARGADIHSSEEEAQSPSFSIKDFALRLSDHQNRLMEESKRWQENGRHLDGEERRSQSRTPESKKVRQMYKLYYSKIAILLLNKNRYIYKLSNN